MAYRGFPLEVTGKSPLIQQTLPQTVGICKGLLLSTENIPTRPYFDGYFFSNADFVVGKEGAEQYRHDNRSIPIGEDGCYVVGHTREGGYEIGTDFSGNYRLFLYRAHDWWAVSNSVMALAESAMQSGRLLTLNHAQLQAWRFRGPFCNQLTSFRTIFNEIELVPSDKSLYIQGDKLGVVDRPGVQLENNRSYEECLGRFLTIWLARLRVLLHHEPFKISVDLSGGLDSRLVFAFFVHLEKRYNENIFSAYRSRINTRIEPHMRADFETAREVRAALGIVPWESGSSTDTRINPSAGDGGAHAPAQTAFAHWRTGSMAQYSPFKTLPTRHADWNSVRFGGPGGGEYRPFYKAASVQEQALQYRNEFDSVSAFADWSNPIDQAVEYLVNRQSGEVDPLLLHYREFRSRFHSGSRAMVSVSVFPLKSSLLRDAADKAGNSRLANRQIFFDIIHSLEPMLLRIAFDKPNKSPTDMNLRYLSEGRIGMLEPGRIYTSRDSSSDSDKTGKRDTDSTPFYVMEQIVHGNEHRVPRTYVKRRLLKTVMRDVVRGRKKNGFVRQNEAVDLHYVLLIIELLTLDVLQGNRGGWRQRLRRALTINQRR